MREYRMSWFDFNFYLWKLVRQIGETPDYIIAVLTGGSVVASHLASLLQTRLGFYGIRRYDDRDAGNVQVYHTKVDLSGAYRILVVDDIVDRGITMQHIVSSLEKPCRTASLVVKKGSMFTPDYSAFVVDDDVWVVFPWEVEG